MRKERRVRDGGVEKDGDRKPKMNGNEQWSK